MPLVTPRQILEIVDERLEPQRLTPLQTVILLRSLEGQHYRAIAAELGYDSDYVKEVGARLWQSLSAALALPLTKKTVGFLLTRWAEAAMAPPPLTELAYPGGAIPIGHALYIEQPPLENLAYQEILRPAGVVRIKAARQMGKTSGVAD